MKTLYVNNYKGFTNTYVPFLDVNFFVGENSTGKTAILNLISILSDLKFWFSPDFNNEFVELGYFNEIVNQRSDKKKCFEIGLEYEVKKTTKSSWKYIWLKFEEKDNRPYVKEFRMVIGNQSVYVDIFSKWAEYCNEDFKNESFQDWITNHKHLSCHKTRVSYPKEMKNIPFGVIRSSIIAMISGSSEAINFENLTFSTPYEHLIWLSPIRAKAQRYYESYKSNYSPEGSHTPIILKKILSTKAKEKNIKIIENLNKFGEESGLFDTIQITEFGKGKGSPFSININYDTLPIKITNVGYGVSQILPIIVELLTTKNGVLAFQQPEVHLHPKAQASFGDLIFISANDNKNKFFIETHSDFTINRYRYRIYKSDAIKNTQGQVLFFERDSKGTHITSLPFNDNGQYPENTPESYSKFFLDEELNMLEF